MWNVARRLYRKVRPWQGRELTPAEVAQVIEDLLADGGGPWDWDDFISVPIKDPELEAIRQRCGALPDEFPADDASGYCGAPGNEVLREIATALRERAS